MARLSENLRFYLGRLGRAGTFGALLIVAGLAYETAVVSPREAMIAEQLERNEKARSEQAAILEKAEKVVASGTNQSSLSPAATTALKRLFEAADRAGLKLDQGEYRLAEARDGGLRLYQLSLPVYGSYKEIRTFISEALNANPALALSAVQLRRDTIESPDIDGQLNFTLYLESGA